MRVITIFLFILAIQTINANTHLPKNKEVLEQLICKFDTLKQDQPDSTKLRINQECIYLFSKILKDTESFYDSFKELTSIGKIVSNDGKVKIYTWGFPLQDKSFTFGGFIQKKERKEITTTPLSIKNSHYVPLENRNITHNNWYGALYYKVIKIKQRRKEYYIALGWSGNNATTDFKVIEPICFDKKGNVSQFGAPIFKKNNKSYSRIVLEYTSEGKVTLNMDESNEQILFDHLIPIEPMYEGIKAYYGPDFTYDAFLLNKKGEWIFKENVDARNKQ